MNKMDVLTLAEVKRSAKKQLPYKFFNYIEGGSQNEETVEENRKAFRRLKIIPRVLRNVSDRSLTTSILGNEISMPIGMSPTAWQKLCNPDGEIATAKACNTLQTVMTISFWSSYTAGEILHAYPDTLCFQQIFITNPKDIVRKIVQDAEKCNIKALVVTLDQPVYGKHLGAIRNSMTFIRYLTWFNKELQRLKTIHGEDIATKILNDSQSWKDFVWLKSITKLPVIAKGILTAEDAREALKHGADAIWVSNHGGRQLDSTPATIDVLPEIVEAVNGSCEVYVDSGFRTGLDVFKGLALGANMVFVGRPVLYGLAHDGANGVQNVFDILKNELDNTMALSGCKDLSQIKNTNIARCTCKM